VGLFDAELFEGVAAQNFRQACPMIEVECWTPLRGAALIWLERRDPRKAWTTFGTPNNVLEALSPIARSSLLELPNER